MLFIFVGVYACLTDFILQNKETRNNPLPTHPKKRRKKSPKAICLEL